MKSLARHLIKTGHRLTPAWLKRRLRTWYRRNVYFRLFPELVPSDDTPRVEVTEVLPRVQSYLNDVGERGRPTLICLPIIDWYFRFQRPQHLLIQFAARGHRVLYLDPLQDGAPYRSTGTLVDRYTMPLTDNVRGVKLPTGCNYNIYTSTLDEKVASRMAADFAELALELGVGEAVLFVELPFWEPLARRLRQELGWGLIYDCIDDHAGFSNTTAAMLQCEEPLLRDADLVVVSSRLLRDRAAPQAKQVVLVPNGCDHEHFAEAIPHPDLAGLPRPIVGYFGAIAEWFDAQLIRGAAQFRPEWSFVLVGQMSEENIGSLRDLPNVHLLGERHYAILPQYLAGFDVCLIPFRDTPLTQATNPVKLFEYFSAGKPVVSTPLPEVEAYGNLVEFARTPEELVRGIEAGLASGPAVAQRRREVARESTWASRAEAIETAWQRSVPLTSIVVVTWNNWHYTRACLDSILRFTSAGQYEVLVVDNASTDQTRLGLYGYQQQYPAVRVLFNDSNRGFSAANNQGLREARGEWLVLLNNDTLVTPGWLRGLGRHLRDPGVGMVGPVTNCIANEACIPTDYVDLPGMLRHANLVRRNNAFRSFDIPMLAMYCVAMRRDVYERVGELDEQFGLGMFEDDDYSLRIRQAGLRVVCAEDVFIHHFSRTSFGRLDPEEYNRIFTRNRALFEAKWNRTWQPQRMRTSWTARTA